MRLAILGGGGFRVPLVYRALQADRAEPRVEEVVLYDRDRARLAVVQAVLAQLAAESPNGPPPPRVRVTTELDDALQGSDFVFSAIRVGGLEGRIRDERIALGLGVLGQETTGAGGLAYALRTVPVARAIAERVAVVAPEAYVIDFTNPAGIVTEAMQAVLGDRVIGICDTPSALAARAIALLGLDPARTRVDYVGLNHLGWLRGLVVDGRDRLPELLASDGLLGRTEEAQLFGLDWLRTLGALPNEYLSYYYFTRDAVRRIAAAEATRGEFLQRQQRAFYERAGADLSGALRAWREALAEREATYMAELRDGAERPGHPAGTGGSREAGGSREHSDDREQSGGGYEQIALGVMAAIARDEPTTMIVNVRNGTTIGALPADCVVEVPALVDGSGARPLATAPPDLHQTGLMCSVKAVERLIIRAAVSGSRELAVEAFAFHPLVDSVSTARALVEAYLADGSAESPVV